MSDYEPISLPELIELQIAVGGLSPAQAAIFQMGADRIRELEAEVARQKGLVRNYLETIEGNEIDISGLLDKLRAVGELPRYTDVEVMQILAREPLDPYWVRADELEAEVARLRGVMGCVAAQTTDAWAADRLRENAEDACNG